MIHKINEYLHSLPEDTLNAFIGILVTMFVCMALVGYYVTRPIDNKDEEEKI